MPEFVGSREKTWFHLVPILHVSVCLGRMRGGGIQNNGGGCMGRDPLGVNDWRMQDRAVHKSMIWTDMHI